jgi:two-component sensor histidine kinase
VTESRQLRKITEQLYQGNKIILKEVHHRIKNNMSTMKSILSLQASALTDNQARAALKDSEERMHAMMLLYDKLYRSEGFTKIPLDEYLDVLTDEIVANLPHQTAIEIKKDLDQFEMDSKRLSSIGLIVNELITNAMKYAFIGRPRGTLSISAKQVGKHVSIVVRDDGVGIPESFNIKTSASFGLELVRMLADQLQGTIRVDRDGGTKWTLEFDV